MSNEKDGPTRKELADALSQSQLVNAKLMERLDALEAKAQTPTVSVQEAILQRDLDTARADIAAKQKLLDRAATHTTTADVKLTPYVGLVKAIAPCCMDTKYEVDAVFEVKVPALWTDDPYVPVRLIDSTTDDQGNYLNLATEPNPNAPEQIHFRFRKVVSQAEDPTPRRAESF